MAIYEKNGVLNYLDAEGNKNILYPVTKAEDVDGLDEELALKVNVADVINNLTSTDTTKPLSAKQGKTLQDTKQEKLVSGTNIKTINGTSILGSGDMTTPLPTASASTLGGVKIGSGINVTSEGVISAQSYSLPTASASVKGGVKIGSGLKIANEVALVDTSVVQEKLTSGTSIKSINDVSILGSGNIAIGLKETLLWTNPNTPTYHSNATFGEQYISIDLSDFDFIKITAFPSTWDGWSGSQSEYVSAFLPKYCYGKCVYVGSNGKVKYGIREVMSDDTQILFGLSNTISGIGNGGQIAIPLKIYGVKVE